MVCADYLRLWALCVLGILQLLAPTGGLQTAVLVFQIAVYRPLVCDVSMLQMTMLTSYDVSVAAQKLFLACTLLYLHAHGQLTEQRALVFRELANPFYTIAFARARDLPELFMLAFVLACELNKRAVNPVMLYVAKIVRMYYHVQAI